MYTGECIEEVYMITAARPSFVRTISREDAIRELSSKIAQYESIYELSSEQMLAMVQRGERPDTAEIAQWMVWYRTLIQLGL